MLGGVLTALALAEAAVRVLDIGPSFQVLHSEMFRLSENPVLSYELAPGARDGDARINSAGFRDREFALEKPSGVFRIVAVGDSVTFGVRRKSAGETWPKDLERSLNHSSQGTIFEVLNLGVIGYNVLQIAERLRVLGLRYHPDLVLYGYVLNDPQEFSLERDALIYLRDAAEERFYRDLQHGLLRALSNSRLFLLLRSRFRDPEPTNPAENPASRLERDPAYNAIRRGDTRGVYFRVLHEDPEGRARLRTGFDRLASLANGAHVPLVVAIFPLLLDPRAGPYPLSDVHALVAHEARRRGFDVIDLETVLVEACAETPCHDDFMHPNSIGNRVVGRALAESLHALGRLPAGSIAPELLRDAQAPRESR